MVSIGQGSFILSECEKSRIWKRDQEAIIPIGFKGKGIVLQHFPICGPRPFPRFVTAFKSRRSDGERQ